MVESHMETAQTMIDATFQLQHRSRADIDSFRRDINETRRAIAASRDLLKRFRQRQMDEAFREVERHPVSAFDADILRKVFQDLAFEMKTPQSEWRDLAKSLVYEFTGCERIEAGLVDWIITE
ncbi:hypothetical protein FJ955_03140 [Mesorhizobium sp. B2-2-2]|uniref:hypothetical protein n=1 Tax=Mesorhizobium sp. B2-2-2 TaxID=2589964 RepID=UPI00112C92D4|nr:hypothetical protein [Mesorhizobium sp. B2-2-2]TPM33748.1 hypothetical protein FJ955_03140 [Mesorhizobium sp. B2-2-2]